MVDLLWWHWLALSALLVVAEFTAAKTSVLWWALATFLVGVVVLLWPGAMAAGIQIALWLVLSALSAVAWYRLIRPRLLSGATIDLARDNAIGEAGRVVAVTPSGKISVDFEHPVVDSNRWQCLCDQPVAEGDTVHIMCFEGDIPVVVRL